MFLTITPFSCAFFWTQQIRSVVLNLKIRRNLLYFALTVSQRVHVWMVPCGLWLFYCRYIFFSLKRPTITKTILYCIVTFALGDMISLIFSNYLFFKPHSKNMTLHMSILIFVLIFDSIKHCSNLTKPNRWLELVMRYLIFFFVIYITIIKSVLIHKNFKITRQICMWVKNRSDPN